MLLRQTVGPATTPVSVTDVKAAPPTIDHTDDDDALGDLLDAAARTVGEMAGRVLVPETWTVSFAAGAYTDLPLPKSPVSAVTMISYFDANDTQRTANVSDFYLVSDDDRAFLRPKRGVAWPSANSLRPDAITVTFTAGYSACPQNLKRAVILLTKHLYDYGAVVTDMKAHEVPMGIQALIDVDRLGWARS